MLEVRNVHVHKGTATVLDGVSMQLAGGEIIAIVGPNGAGKSTLLRVLAGLEPPRDGQVLLDSVPLATFGREHRARRVGYLPQERRIEWSLTVRQIVELARTPHADNAEAMIEMAMAEAGIAHLADRSIETLSGGEQARVLFARLLGVNADYMLVDEPVMALDPKHQLALMETLRRAAARGAGVAVSLHDLTHVTRFADQVILIECGRIVAAGATTEVLTPERIADIYAIESLEGNHESQRYIVPWRIRAN